MSFPVYIAVDKKKKCVYFQGDGEALFLMILKYYEFSLGPSIYAANHFHIISEFFEGYDLKINWWPYEFRLINIIDNDNVVSRVEDTVIEVDDEHGLIFNIKATYKTHLKLWPEVGKIIVDNIEKGTVISLKEINCVTSIDGVFNDIVFISSLVDNKIVIKWARNGLRELLSRYGAAEGIIVWHGLECIYEPWKKYK